MLNDLDRTRDFYGDKLGLPLISLVRGRHVFFKAGNSMLLCFLAEATKKEKELPPHDACGSIHFAFEVSREDYINAITQIKNAGISIVHEPIWKCGRCSFYFHDPDENLVEIIEQGLWDDNPTEQLLQTRMF